MLSQETAAVTRLGRTAQMHVRPKCPACGAPLSRYRSQPAVDEPVHSNGCPNCQGTVVIMRQMWRCEACSQYFRAENRLFVAASAKRTLPAPSSRYVAE
jgi:ribosomal protein L37AE/L43A